MSPALSTPFALTQAAPPKPTVAAGASAAKIHKTAQAFEASFLSSMLNSMFDGVKTEAPFGGGEAETTFRSFLTDAMAKSIVRRGGIGVSAVVERELIKLQHGSAHA